MQDREKERARLVTGKHGGRERESRGPGGNFRLQSAGRVPIKNRFVRRAPLFRGFRPSFPINCRPSGALRYKRHPTVFVRTSLECHERIFITQNTEGGCSWERSPAGQCRRGTHYTCLYGFTAEPRRKLDALRGRVMTGDREAR